MNPVLLSTIAAAVILLPLLLAAIAMQYTGPRAKIRARLAVIAGGGTTVTGTAAQRRSRHAAEIKTRLQDSGHSGSGQAGRRAALRLRLDRAGLEISSRAFVISSALAGAVGAALYLLCGFKPLFAPAAAVVAGLGAPRFLLTTLARRRQHAFTAAFADAVDIIVRGIRTGLPVGECFGIIARESPDPVGAEFRLIIDGQKLGMTMKQALERARRRIPTPDMKFFAIVLTLQQHTGGNLAETLAGLSALLRSRKKMADKVRAMSSEARMTATIIGSLPFLLSAAIYAINPHYMTLLWTDPIGRVILFGGLAWMAAGVVVMKQMISFEI